MIGPSALQAQAAVSPVMQPRDSKSNLVDRLTSLRTRVMDVESSLVDGLKTKQQAQTNVQKIRLLLKLQKEERALGQQRLSELQATVEELESRRRDLHERIETQRFSLRKSLAAIERATREGTPNSLEEEKLEAPRRKTLQNLVDRGLKETEALKIDLADADMLEGHIGDERQQLTYLFHDLDEQQSVLELNRQLQADLIQRKHEERVAQLDNYRKLKTSELQVESLIKNFNAHMELETANEAERQASRELLQGPFASVKGKLPLPVAGGKILTAFGRTFDSRSGLFVFKKGVDIGAYKKQPVTAVFAGTVAFAGELAGYGRVAIIDHGNHFYSLCAHLGDFSKKQGDSVAAGDTVATTDDSGTPVYFEIRSRNVAVNPLQWVSN